MRYSQYTPTLEIVNILKQRGNKMSWQTSFDNQSPYDPPFYCKEDHTAFEEMDLLYEKRVQDAMDRLEEARQEEELEDDFEDTCKKIADHLNQWEENEQEI